MLICNAAVGKFCLWVLSEIAHSSGMANTLSSGLPGLYTEKSAKYSSASSDVSVKIPCQYNVCKHVQLGCVPRLEKTVVSYNAGHVSQNVFV